MSNLLENIGNLTSPQKSLLEEMKRRFSAYKEDYMKDEYYLLHWLIARKFNIDGAEEMLIKHYRCRKALGMDEDKYKKFEVNPLMAKYYPHGVFNHDKNGHPVAYLPIGGIDAKGVVTNVKTSDIYKAIMFWQEQRKWNCADATKKFGKRIQQATYIIDLNGLGPKHLWKPGLDAFIEIAHLVEQHTPEIMYKLFIINAPLIFPIIYKLVKPVLDENTTKKIEIYSDDFKEALLNIIDIDQLPACYGGTAVIEDDPGCSPHISYGGTVPLELYLRPDQCMLQEADCKEIRIKSGSYMQVPIVVTNDGSILEWHIKSDSTNDFFFGIFRTDISSPETSIDKMEMIIPYFRTYAFYVPESGQHKAQIGKYIFHFDNSHSWVTSKTLKYVIHMLDEEDQKISL